MTNKFGEITGVLYCTVFCQTNFIACFCSVNSFSCCKLHFLVIPSKVRSLSLTDRLAKDFAVFLQLIKKCLGLYFTVLIALLYFSFCIRHMFYVPLFGVFFYFQIKLEL